MVHSTSGDRLLPTREKVALTWLVQFVDAGQFKS